MVSDPRVENEGAEADFGQDRGEFGIRGLVLLRSREQQVGADGRVEEVALLRAPRHAGLLAAAVEEDSAG